MTPIIVNYIRLGAKIMTCSKGTYQKFDHRVPFIIRLPSLEWQLRQSKVSQTKISKSILMYTSVSLNVSFKRKNNSFGQLCGALNCSTLIHWFNSAWKPIRNYSLYGMFVSSLHYLCCKSNQFPCLCHMLRNRNKEDILFLLGSEGEPNNAILHCRSFVHSRMA